MDNFPSEVLPLVPVLETIPPITSKSLEPSGDSDTNLLGLIPDDTPPDASANKEGKEFSIAPNLTSGPALVRTISEVTNFDGPSPKRAGHHVSLWSSVSCHSCIREFDLIIHEVNVTNAFLNEDLHERFSCNLLPVLLLLVPKSAILARASMV